MNLFHKIVISTLLAFLSTTSLAVNDTTSFFTKTVKKPIYEGWATCSAKVNGYEYTLDKFISNTTLSQQPIIKNIDGNTLECLADIPLKSYEAVIQTSTKIDPIAKYTVSTSQDLFGQTWVTLTDASTDADGYIVSSNWSIDGAFKTMKSSFTFAVTKPGARKVSLTVRDNDGFKATLVKWEDFFTNTPPCDEC